MTEENTELTPETDRPRYEWPIGGLVRIREDAGLSEDRHPLRGELAVVVGPLGMVVSDLDSGPMWKWVQKIYCPQRREYLFIQPESIAVLGGEPSEQGILDEIARTAPLVRAGLARTERGGPEVARPNSAPAVPGQGRQSHDEEGRS